jgi:hypothetical protein
MMEEQPVSTILTTLHATDADSTISEYQLIDGDGDNGGEFFEINNVTGEAKSAASVRALYCCSFFKKMYIYISGQALLFLSFSLSLSAAPRSNK